MKTVVHIVPHAHWDREWYLPLEQHRARLLTQLDRVLALLEQNPAYTYHLDGQMIAVEDYLALRPEREEQLRRFAAQGRLTLGPWYVLQDEYLTSGEANVRNLLHGMALARKYGPVCPVGYLPDAFGNVGQMPQLLRQAGMTSAAFGRGVTLRETDPDPKGHFPRYSEFLWQSPDGSAIPATYFSGWYNNAAEIPTDPAKAKPYWDERLQKARRFAASRHLLFMNGSDHQPVQQNLAEAIKTARALYPEIEFRCSDLASFAEAVQAERDTAPEIVAGELCGQESAGDNTLCNTASSRAPIKSLNRRAESQLSLVAEPLMAMAAMAGAPQEQALLRRAWKLVLENHPHDSICGCGIDEVHRETVYRYEKSLQLADYLMDAAAHALAERIAAPQSADAAAAFTVVNPTAWQRTQTVSAVIGLDRVYGTRDAREAAQGQPVRALHLRAANGESIPCTVEELGVQFGYDLPDDRFRQPYFERRYRITFSAKELPAFGYAVYYVKTGAATAAKGLCAGQNRMENEFVAVTVQENGTFDLLDKTTGRSYTGLGVYEDTGDVGDEYIFRETVGRRITSEGLTAKITCTEDAPQRTTFRIETTLTLPVSADEAALTAARESMEPRLQRKIERSPKTVQVPVETLLSLEPGSPVVRLKTRFVNTVRDHRLRLLFPTDTAGKTHLADSMFDLIERGDVPGPNWTNPSRCQRMQYLVAAEDEAGGLAVLNRGAYEYEILPERKQIAVTVLRSVAELGDWGVFPTPDAECLGPVELELGILPYAAGALQSSGLREAVWLQADPVVIPIPEAAGTLPERFGFVTSEGKGVCVTALKPSEDGKAMIVRGVNVQNDAAAWRLGTPLDAAWYDSDICERQGDAMPSDADGTVTASANGKELKTVRIEFC